MFRSLESNSRISFRYQRSNNPFETNIIHPFIRTRNRNENRDIFVITFVYYVEKDLLLGDISGTAIPDQRPYDRISFIMENFHIQDK